MPAIHDYEDLAGQFTDVYSKIKDLGHDFAEGIDITNLESNSEVFKRNGAKEFEIKQTQRGQKLFVPERSMISRLFQTLAKEDSPLRYILPKCGVEYLLELDALTAAHLSKSFLVILGKKDEVVYVQLRGRAFVCVLMPEDGASRSARLSAAAVSQKLKSVGLQQNRLTKGDEHVLKFDFMPGFGDSFPLLAIPMLLFDRGGCLTAIDDGQVKLPLPIDDDFLLRYFIQLVNGASSTTFKSYDLNQLGLGDIKAVRGQTYLVSLEATDSARSKKFPALVPMKKWFTASGGELEHSWSLDFLSPAWIAIDYDLLILRTPQPSTWSRSRAEPIEYNIGKATHADGRPLVNFEPLWEVDAKQADEALMKADSAVPAKDNYDPTETVARLTAAVAHVQPRQFMNVLYRWMPEHCQGTPPDVVKYKGAWLPDVKGGDANPVDGSWKKGERYVLYDDTFQPWEREIKEKGKHDTVDKKPVPLSDDRICFPTVTEPPDQLDFGKEVVHLGVWFKEVSGKWAVQTHEKGDDFATASTTELINGSLYSVILTPLGERFYLHP